MGKSFDRSITSWIIFKGFLAILIFACLFLTACSDPRVSNVTVTDSFNVTVPHQPIAEGAIFSISVHSSEVIDSIEGSFQKQKLEFFLDSPGNWIAIAGVEVDSKSGNVPMRIVAHTKKGKVERSIEIAVIEGTFPSEVLKVPPRKVAPLAADLPKIKRDQALLAHVYVAGIKKKMWDLPLMMPIESAITSVFGSKRVYNGIKQSAHYGTDLRAPQGTQIRAPLSGKVALARTLFFTGNTIILDHGFGLFTIYGHLSKLEVKENTEVQKGTIMGLSGMTGRASGPHLHWGVHLHGAKLDPMTLAVGLVP